MKYLTNSPEETVKLAEQIAKKMKPGDVIALVGELGSGKTVFAKGIARGLGVKDPEHVSSPTFVIVKSYPGKKLIFHHFDAYRLANPPELAAIGVQEYFESGGVCAIEWADKVRPLLPDEHIRVEFRIMSENKREITIQKVA